MGQRLVVSIQNEGREIATVYYHWSAYTVSALWEVSKLVKRIFNHQDETEEELKLRLIRFCEENGGGINNYVRGFLIAVNWSMGRFAMDTHMKMASEFRLWKMANM